MYTRRARAATGRHGGWPDPRNCGGNRPVAASGRAPRVRWTVIPVGSVGRGRRSSSSCGGEMLVVVGTRPPCGIPNADYIREHRIPCVSGAPSSDRVRPAVPRTTKAHRSHRYGRPSQQSAVHAGPRSAPACRCSGRSRSRSDGAPTPSTAAKRPGLMRRGAANCCVRVSRPGRRQPPVPSPIVEAELAKDVGDVGLDRPNVTYRRSAICGLLRPAANGCARAPPTPRRPCRRSVSSLVPEQRRRSARPPDRMARDPRRPARFQASRVPSRALRSCLSETSRW